MSAPTPEPTSAPTLDQIRDAWVHDRDGVSHRPWGEQPTQAWSRRRSEFDRALAAHDARVRAEALREAADAWQVGGWADDLPKGTARPALILGMAQRATNWLRVRADRLAAGGEA